MTKDATLPATWKTTTLSAVAQSFLSGGTPSTKNEAFWQGSVPWITSKWLNSRLYLDSGEKLISDDAVRQSTTTVVPRNNLIFATRVGVGKVAVNRLDLAINQDLAGVLIDSNRYDIRFIAYQLRSERIQNVVASHKRGATIQGITRDNLKKLEVNLPPLSEQRKIAGVLGLVQRAIEQQERLIALTTELKKALLLHLFTHGLRGESQKQTEIGPVPESWEQRPLDQVGDVVYGIQAAVAANLRPIGTKILTNKNITLDGRITLEAINYFVLKTPRHHATVLKKGDLLFNWRSGSKEHVGKTAFFDLDGEFTHSSFILRIRPHDEVSGRHLFYYLNFLRESAYFVKTQTFAVNAKFNKSAINKLPTYLPGEDERQEIVTALDAVSLKLKTLQSKHATLSDLFRTLLHQLMTAQIRVHDLDLDGILSQAVRENGDKRPPGFQPPLVK
jgi:type I restriction enzyme S subunit